MVRSEHLVLCCVNVYYILPSSTAFFQSPSVAPDPRDTMWMLSSPVLQLNVADAFPKMADMRSQETRAGKWTGGYEGQNQAAQPTCHREGAVVSSARPLARVQAINLDVTHCLGSLCGVYVVSTIPFCDSRECELITSCSC